MFEPIELDPDQYWSVALLFLLVGLFITMHFMVEIPKKDEEDEDDEF